MSSVSRYFFMSPCMLSLHHFLGLPDTSSLSDFAQMWLGSRLKQWPNHFSLLFSRKVSTGFTWASFLMSSFLMWSNLVFPLAHLNILISAEFSLLSSLFNPRNGHVRSIGREFLCAKRPKPIRPVADVVLFTVLFIHK